MNAGKYKVPLRVTFVDIIFTRFLKLDQVASRLKFGKTDTQMVFKAYC
jgi:hypothetical protein